MSSCTRRVQLSCVMMYTTNIVVVCHVVDDECSGGPVSSCTLRLQLSCVMLYTTNIMVVVCHVVHVEYSGGRVSSCTRRRPPLYSTCTT